MTVEGGRSGGLGRGLCWCSRGRQGSTNENTQVKNARQKKSIKYNEWANYGEGRDKKKHRAIARVLLLVTVAGGGAKRSCLIIKALNGKHSY